jgi:hypothetical protein
MRRMVALGCAVVLGCGALTASADADGIVPVEGPWHATTSAGLPVSFEVGGGQVAGVQYRFKWGFCGTYTSHLAPSVAIEPSGHWKVADPSGPYIEGTFVAPDRAEGTVVAPSRMLPGCPMTQAKFTAEPGTASFKEPEAVVLSFVGRNKYATEPKTMVIKRDGSLRFEGLQWHGWGGEVTRATGRAFIGIGRVIRRPRVSVKLEELVEGGEQRRYRHRGERLMYEYARG